LVNRVVTAPDGQCCVYSVVSGVVYVVVCVMSGD